MLFDGIEKGVFYEAKFDSLPELKLARILDKQGSPAQKWLRPAAQEFSLKYEYDGTYHEYQPDFVVEMVDMRYLVEVKGMDKLNDPQVLAKKARGQAYCQIVTDWATAAGSSLGSIFSFQRMRYRGALLLNFWQRIMGNEVLIMNQDSMEFVVYMIHACANTWNLSPKQVYHKLQETGCIDEYLVPNYDILHTQGSGYLVDDIKEYLRIRGVKI